MFLSYEHRYLDNHKQSDYLDNTHYRWEYDIIDSEFEETGIVTFGIGGWRAFAVVVAVIETYEKRNLNVAANLIRSFMWYNKEYGTPIDGIIKNNKLYNPKFSKYEQEVNKYIILI